MSSLSKNLHAQKFSQPGANGRVLSTDSKYIIICSVGLTGTGRTEATFWSFGLDVKGAQNLVLHCFEATPFIQHSHSIKLLRINRL